MIEDNRPRLGVLLDQWYVLRFDDERQRNIFRAAVWDGRVTPIQVTNAHDNESWFVRPSAVKAFK